MIQENIYMVEVGDFRAYIDKVYEDRPFFYIRLESTPRSNLIDNYKGFYTIRKAEEYYKEQLKKILKRALKECV